MISALPTKKTDGKASLENLRMMLYAEAKMGKTYLCSGFPDSLFIATERAQESLSLLKQPVNTWEELIQVIDLIVLSKGRYKYVIVDTFGEACRLCEEFVCEKLNIDHLSDADFSKGYDLYKYLLDRAFSKLFNLNIGTILLAHTRVVERTIKGGGKITKIMVDLKNSARNVILPKVDCVGYLKMKACQKGSGRSVSYYEKRVVTFDPSQFEEAGDRNGVLHEIESFENPEETYRQIKNAFETKGDS